MREPLVRLIEYNRALVGPGRDPAWLTLKLDRMTSSAFAFLRGTFHLFMSDWPEWGDDPIGPGPPQPIVGDLHLENFGAFKTREGFVFDVNDFDETGTAQPVIDVARVCTSFVLADEKHGELRAVERIGAFLGAYVKAAREMDLRPLTPDTAKLPSAVLSAIERAGKLSRGEWLERYVQDHHFAESERYHPVADPALREKIFAAARSFGEPIDTAVRIAGTGSLGRFRYAVLVADPEKKKKELVLELKEARASALEPAGEPAAQAKRVVANQRLLQGASPEHLGIVEIGGASYTVRELQPSDAKLKTEALSGSERDELCASCGTVLGRLHARGAHDYKSRLIGRERALLRRMTAFALRYADVVTEDFELLRARRDEVQKALA